MASKSRIAHQLGATPLGIRPSPQPWDTLPQANRSQPDNRSPAKVLTQQATQSRVHSQSPRRVSPGAQQRRAKPIGRVLSVQESQSAPLVIPPPVIPNAGAEIPCTVTHITDHHNFSIVFQDKEYLYTELLRQLALFSPSDLRAPTLGSGDACLALYPADNTWHRAVVTEAPSKKTVTIRYVDYGDTKKVKIADVQTIPSMLCQYPARAVKCKLNGVESSLSPRASLLFCQLVSSTELLAWIHVNSVYSPASVGRTSLIRNLDYPNLHLHALMRFIDIFNEIH